MMRFPATTASLIANRFVISNARNVPAAFVGRFSGIRMMSDAPTAKVRSNRFYTVYFFHTET